MSWNIAKYAKAVVASTAGGSFEDQIRSWLNAEAERDTNLAKCYTEETDLKDCIDFIFEAAEELAEDNRAVLNDGTVYRMAKDYFVDDIKKKQAEADKEEKKACEERLAKTTEPKEWKPEDYLNRVGAWTIDRMTPEKVAMLTEEEKPFYEKDKAIEAVKKRHEELTPKDLAKNQMTLDWGE